MKGLVFDLVIWNEDASSYRQVLHDELMGLVLTGSEAGLLDHAGGVFIRRGDLISEEDRVLLQALARVTLQESRGRLADQIDRPTFSEARMAPFVASKFILLQTKPSALIAPQSLKFFNGFGGFTKDGREYAILVKHGHETPAPWAGFNVITAIRPGTARRWSSESSVYSWVENAHEYRLTPWHNDALTDASGECVYIRDEESGAFWSPTPYPARGKDDYLTRHGFGYSAFETVQNGIRSELTLFVAPDAPVKLALLRIRNESNGARRISATAYWEWVLGESRAKNYQHVVTDVDLRSGAVFARNAYNTDFQTRIAFCASSDRTRTLTCDRAEFLGRNGSYDNPDAMRRRRLSGRYGAALDPCTALQSRFELAAGQERTVVFILGAANNANDAQAFAQRFQSVDAAQRALEDTRQRAGAARSKRSRSKRLIRRSTLLANGWLLYQVLSSRVWARSGFYQSGGAYGFRDQLQDVLALLYAAPELTREHVLRCAARQFEEGDVQHWWHPPQGRGVRTHFSDDFLWLPYAACRYVLATGDIGVLNEKSAFIGSRAPSSPMKKPTTICRTRRINPIDALRPLRKRARSSAACRALGRHGLPLMGCGDWNDGMNLVGVHGEGESVWLAFFLFDVLNAIRGRRAACRRIGARRTVRIVCPHAARQHRHPRLGRRLVSARVLRRRLAAGIGIERRVQDRFAAAKLGGALKSRLARAHEKSDERGHGQIGPNRQAPHPALRSALRQIRAQSRLHQSLRAGRARKRRTVHARRHLGRDGLRRTRRYRARVAITEHAQPDSARQFTRGDSDL